MEKRKYWGMLITMLLTSSVIAKNPPHTWHTVSSSDGIWDAKVQMLNEGGFFVNRAGEKITNFVISPNHPEEYGFTFDQGDDFNVAYTLTLTQQTSNSRSQFSSKACVYVITASGPAMPDIRPASFNGAKCDWKVVKGVGEDFFVS